MAQIVTYQSAVVDFVNGSVPRTINIYTVPSGSEFCVAGALVSTQSITGSGEPTIIIGNTGNPTAYQSQLQTANYLDFPTLGGIPQTVPIAAGITITATITANSAATAHEGFVSIHGFLIEATGQDNYPLPPTPSTLTGYLYVLDSGGNPITTGVNISFSLAASLDGSGVGWNTAPTTVVSDDTGLVQIPIEPNASYQIWSGCGDPVVVSIPANPSNPYPLPNLTIRSS